MNLNNRILSTDSYKLTHWNQYPPGTEAVYSYFESRGGATFPYTVFFGLQYILKHYLEGSVVTWDDLSEAHALSVSHFGNNKYFNYAGWSRIISEHGGRPPLRIRAVPEGTVVPTGNVLMTVENTDPECFWLTNAVESLLTHVWYPSTVATLSHFTKGIIAKYLEETAESTAGLPYMLQDFGYRGASTHETAAIGGAAHLVNFVGTDTLPAMLMAMEYYKANLDTLAFSVAATEHSVMTAQGEEGEFDVVSQLLDEYPDGILSVVADSYNIYRFVHRMGGEFKERILARDGVFVVRPDSPTPRHPHPEDLVVEIMDQLWFYFQGEINSKGYKVLDPHIRVLWGDGLDYLAIERILAALAANDYSAENIACFGMGGGLLQKVNRDTQRFAFKASAIKRAGEWHEISKHPLDASKVSKKGRLRLTQTVNGEYLTLPEDPDPQSNNLLELVYENGHVVTTYTFDEVRENAHNGVAALA